MNRQYNVLHLILIVAALVLVVAVSLEDKVCSAEDDECTNDINVDNNVDINCIDEHENCKGWAKVGECEANRKYMLVSCRRSCNVCKSEFE
jgi:hypothetical protein